MAMESKSILAYLRKAYFMPQMHTPRDIAEFKRFDGKAETISNVAARLKVSWSTAQAMLERGGHMAEIQKSAKQRAGSGKSEQQWAILLPNRVFYELVKLGIFHPDQLYEKVAKKGRATSGESFAIVETVKAMGRYI